jgi:hypothetical protein
MSSLIQNILVIGGLIGILGFGYYLYTSNGGLETGEQSGSAAMAAQSDELVRRLNELKAIELNGQIFSDPRFLSFVNYSVPVLPEPVGQPNPFEVSN